MRKEISFLIFSIAILLIAGAIFIKSTETSSDKAIENLYKAIEKAEEKGDYRCCIDPPCTMCFLGKWKFEKGTCLCDDAIREGRTEDVCPECKKGLEQGLCKSSKTCELNKDE